MPMEDRNWLQYRCCSSCVEKVSNENRDFEFAGIRNRSAVSVLSGNRIDSSSNIMGARLSEGLCGLSHTYSLQALCIFISFSRQDCIGISTTLILSSM